MPAPKPASAPILPHPLPLPSSLTQRRPLVIAFLVLLLLRSRVATLSTNALRTLRDALAKSTEKLTKNLHLTKGKRKLTEDELARVLQQVYVDEPDGSKTLLVPYREGVIKVPIRPTPKSQFSSDASSFPLLPPSTATKPNIDRAFLSQLRAILLRIAIPSWHSSEAGIVALHSSFLVLRTVLSIAVARLDGRIVRDIVKADGRGFLKGLGLWFLLAVPSTFTNSMIRHLQSLLALRLRTRLTRYLHDLYLSSNPDLRYYRATNYLEGVDQYLTADVEAWSNAMSGLYGNILKPSLDLLLFTSQLSRSLGLRGTLLLCLNYYGTVAILRAVTPAFGRLASVEARLEGEYRAGMGRVGREAEEVAFYDGGARERDILTRAYMRLIKHVNSIYKIRIAYEWTEDYVIKYLWSAAGYALIAIPILFTRTKRSLGIQAVEDDALGIQAGKDDAVAGRTETYISNRRLLLSLADAGGRLMYAYKDLLELAGLTTRLYTLLSTLLNLPKGYEPIRVEQGDVVRLSGVDVRIPRVARGKKVEHLEEEPVVEKLVDEEDTDELCALEVEARREREKEAEDPPLVKDLNLVIKRGDHMMITGSNGVGKTAVARVLAGLWDPSAGGQVEMPRDESDVEAFFGAAGPKKPHTGQRPRPTLYVLPQRSYMTVGSLLEQIIYPCSYASFVKMTSPSLSSSSASAASPVSRTASTLLSFAPSLSCATSAAHFSLSPSSSSSPLALAQEPAAEAISEIYGILEKVHLGYLIEREGGLHVRKEWRDVLSGGEKQRMGMARVLWWRPKWAVLDECTSAVSSDAEGSMYEAAKALEITLITISLRPSLMKYHSQLLTLHGPSGSEPGKWTLSRIGTPEERMSVQREIRVLEEKLKEVEGWEKRVKELEGMLGVQDLEGIGEEEEEEEEEGGVEAVEAVDAVEAVEEKVVKVVVVKEEEEDEGEKHASMSFLSFLTASKVGRDQEQDEDLESIGASEDGVVDEEAGLEEDVGSDEEAV